MLKDNLHVKVKQFLSIYHELKDALRWKVTDKRMLMLVSSMYVVNTRAFDLQRYEAVSKHIKSNVDIFNTLRSSQRFPIAAMLDIHFDHPTEKFRSYLDVYEMLVQGGFKRGMFTYIAASIIFTSDLEPTKYDHVIKKAQNIYKAMQKEHLFLTSQNDYPLAILLALRELNIDPLIGQIEQFYRQLNHLGFRKGNDLQFLSHILSLDTRGDSSLLSKRCKQIYERFTQMGTKPKAMNYPTIGMLALCEGEQIDLQQVIQLYERLNSEKDFKWQKDLNFMLAVHLMMSELTENTTLSSTGMMTTIEIIFQAQQAAMIASMAAVSAASTSNNG